MFDFVFYAIIWVLSLYGLIEIIRTIYYICTYEKLDGEGLALIVATKNQEKQIECFCRSLLFRYLAGKKDYLNKIIVADLNSEDNTKEIVKKLEQDYECIELKDWQTCKKELDKIYVKETCSKNKKDA